MSRVRRCRRQIRDGATREGFGLRRHSAQWRRAIDWQLRRAWRAEFRRANERMEWVTGPMKRRTIRGWPGRDREDVASLASPRGSHGVPARRRLFLLERRRRQG